MALAQPSMPAVVGSSSPSQLLGERPPSGHSTPLAIHGSNLAQQLAILRSLQQQQQQQLPRIDASDHRVSSQALSIGGLTSNDFENQLRNRLMLASGLPYVQRPGPTLIGQQLQGLTNDHARRLSGLRDGSFTLPEIRRASLLGSTLPGSADLQRSLGFSAGGAIQGVGPAAGATLDPRTTGFSEAGARLVANTHHGAGNASSIINQSQTSNSAHFARPQFTDSLSLLRLQQTSRTSGDNSAELLMLIEQERQRQQQRQQNERSNG